MSKTAAADAIRSSIRHFRQLADYADMLESIGPLDTAKEEAERSLAKVREELQEAQSSLAKVKLDLQAGKQRAEDAAAMSAALSAETLKRAEAEAEAIIDKAKTENQRLLDRASQRAEAIIESAESKAAETKARTNAALEELNEIVSKQNTAQVQLDTLNQKLAEAKASLASFLNKE